MYALVNNDGTIHVPYRVPNVLQFFDAEGNRTAPDVDLRSMDPGLLAKHGIFEVVPTDRPDDTDTHTHTRTVELVKGVPTVTWTPRPWTDDELAARAAAAAYVDPEERIAALEVEVRGIKDRAAAAQVTGTDAKAVRDAVAGPR